jgi:hypothetical protein
MKDLWDTPIPEAMTYKVAWLLFELGYPTARPARCYGTVRSVGRYFAPSDEMFVLVCQRIAHAIGIAPAVWEDDS